MARKKIALIGTVVRKHSHAQHFLDRHAQTRLLRLLRWRDAEALLHAARIRRQRLLAPVPEIRLLQKRLDVQSAVLQSPTG